MRASLVRWLGLVLLAMPLASHAAFNVLVVTDRQDANGRVNLETHALDALNPIDVMVTDDLRIFHADGYTLSREINRLDRYDVVLLWDVPRKVYKEKGAPEQGERVLLSEADMARLLGFVEEGGGLVVAGGTMRVFCTTQYNRRNPMYGDFTDYGYVGTPLGEALPLAVEGTRVTPRPGASRPQAIEALAKRGSRQVVVADSRLGKGRMLAICWGRKDVRAEGRAWPQEGVFWSTALRWAAGDETPVPAAPSAEMETAYAARIAPPAELPPPEWIADEYPYMLWFMNAATVSAHSEPGFRYFRELGFNRFSMHTADNLEKNGIPAFTNCAQYGLWYYPNIDLLMWDRMGKAFSEEGVETNLWAGMYQDGAVARRYGVWASPFSPLVQDRARHEVQAKVREYLEAATPATRPYLRGYLLDDEQTWWMANGYQGGKPGQVADYSDHANRYFKEKTGLDAPPPVYREPGYVAPASDPWIRWAELIRMRGFSPFCIAVRDAIKEVQPDAEVGWFAGGFWGEGDLIIDEFYHQMWKEDILKTFSTTDLGFMRLDDPKGERTEYWSEIFITKSPGVFGGNKGTAIDPEQLRLTAGLAFGRGLKGLVIWETPYVWQMQRPGHEPLDREVGRIGGFLKQYGPWLRTLKRAESDVWYLGDWIHPNSFDHYRWLTPEIGKAVSGGYPWMNFQVTDIAFPAIIRAQIPAVAVTERQLMSPDLMKRKAVILPAMQYGREEVITNLTAFIEKGGLVFTDASTPVEVPGAIRLSCRFDEWYQDTEQGKRLTGRAVDNTRSDDITNARRENRIRDLIPVLEKEMKPLIDPRITVRDDEAKFWDGFHTLMENGDARYLFVYNYDLDFGRYMQVEMLDDPGYVIDVLAALEQPVETKDGKYRFRAQLEPGGWRIYALLPAKPVGLAGAEAVLKGTDLTVKARWTDEAGATLKAATPVSLTIKGANRDATLYRSIDEGIGEWTIPLEDYVREPKTVVLKDLMIGKTVEAVIQDGE